MNSAQAGDLLARIEGEYREMPGLRLTAAQAQRLWGLDRATCESLMDLLVETRVLCRARDGAFVRLDPNSPVAHDVSPPAPPMGAS